MINYIKANIKKVSVHHVGNKINEEGLTISKSSININDSKLRELLMRFFLIPFSDNILYSFTFSNEDYSLNPLFNFSSKIFENLKNFHASSVDIAKQLYGVSNHPHIKSGDLFVVYFSNLNINNIEVDAVGIFKSDQRQEFLKLDVTEDEFTLDYDDGINIEKIDKGCLIFNTDKDSGYKICIIDKLNKSLEAQYWKDLFLMLRPCNDEYHLTTDFLNIAKKYVTDKMSEEFEITKIDQLNILNRSISYFKENKNFDKVEFEKNVFQNSAIVKSFRKFEKEYTNKFYPNMESTFEISSFAVKKQSRIFKSVLKLDKNFHIYIHGDPDLIEKGEDEFGRKYYKLFYEKEF